VGTQWDDWAKGINCPFCGPRAESNEYWDFVATLCASSLYLSKSQTYLGYCILVLDVRHVTRPGQLSADDWLAFCADLQVAESSLVKILQPDHINLELLGNVVPHLHWQIVPRYRTDPRWEAPIWTTTREEMTVTHLLANERADLIRKLRKTVNSD
jgi:diadenosine tetraphosphate (Ap4A) HIT family hydrolase